MNILIACTVLSTPNPVAGSTIQKCDKCRKEVWVSSATAKNMPTDKEWRAYCEECGFAILKADTEPTITIRGPSPGQRQEMKEAEEADAKRLG